MLLFAIRIVDMIDISLKVIIEEIDQCVDAYHVTDIEVTHHGNRKRDHVKAEMSLLDQFLNAVCQQREPNNGIDPHRVMLLYHTVRTHRVHNGDGYN